MFIALRALPIFLAGLFVLHAAEKIVEKKPESELGRVSQIRSLYVMGPGDEIRIQQPHAEDLDGKVVRVDDLGMVHLAVVGRLQFGGLTIQKAELLLKERLGVLLLDPQPIISITEYRSQPVSVLGAVNNPGIVHLQGRRTLIEIIALAGGFKSDAGNELQLTRRLEYGVLPEQNAIVNTDGGFSSAKIEIKTLLASKEPLANVFVLPQDIISVPQTDLIYVTGSVRKPGGFPIGMHEGISVLQAVSLAEGLGSDASPKRALVLRPRPDSMDKEEIPVDLKSVLAGKTKDFELRSRDILFIPDSTTKKVGYRAAEAALQAVVGVAVYRR